MVFVGRVIRDSGEGWGTGPGRMAIEEVFHGLPKDLREVDVNTMAGTSCYMRLAKDERYLIYGGRDPKQAGVVQNHACSFSTVLHGNEWLVEALRQAEAGRPAVLAGKIYLRTGQYAWAPDGPAGITVVAEGGGVRREVRSGPGGQFQFTSLPAADYRLSVSTPDFFMDTADWISYEAKVTLPARGCANAGLYVWPNGKISGVITSSAGQPLADVPVQVFSFNAKNLLDTQAFRQQKTDGDGRYVIPGLPPGDYVVGVNAEKYNDRAPYPPVVYPGTSNRDEGSRIHVDTGETKTGIDLKVGQPREKAVLVVEMVFEDGTPAAGGSANVQDAAGQQRFFVIDSEKKTSVHRVDVYRGETYQIRASNFLISAANGSNVRMRSKRYQGQSPLISMDAPEKQVRIVLHEVIR